MTVMPLPLAPALRDREPGDTARVKSGGAAWTASASVAECVREPEVPVNVIVGVADAAVMAAVSVVVAEG